MPGAIRLGGIIDWISAGAVAGSSGSNWPKTIPLAVAIMAASDASSGFVGAVAGGGVGVGMGLGAEVGVDDGDTVGLRVGGGVGGGVGHGVSSGVGVAGGVYNSFISTGLLDSAALLLLPVNRSIRNQYEPSPSKPASVMSALTRNLPLQVPSSLVVIGKKLLGLAASGTNTSGTTSVNPNKLLPLVL